MRQTCLKETDEPMQESSHMEKVSYKKYLERRRMEEHHKNNRDRETKLEWDKNGRAITVCYISEHRIKEDNRKWQ